MLSKEQLEADRLTACPECRRQCGGHTIHCSKIADYLDDAREFAVFKGWDTNSQTVVANVASLFLKRGVPDWPRQLGGRRLPDA